MRLTVKPLHFQPRNKNQITKNNANVEYFIFIDYELFYNCFTFQYIIISVLAIALDHVSKTFLNKELISVFLFLKLE